MNMTLLHQLSFYAMYFAVAAVSVVIVERLIFYWFTLRDARQLLGLFSGPVRSDAAAPAIPAGDRSIAGVAVRRLLGESQGLRSRHDLEDLSGALYVEQKAKLEHNLWILDSVVTAAPLMGLLGTILGIIDTFTALAQSGISDPQGVSAGIGTALFATALGIAIALYGLVFLNFFRDRVDRIGDQLKMILMHAALRIELPGGEAQAVAARPVAAGARVAA